MALHYENVEKTNRARSLMVTFAKDFTPLGGPRTDGTGAGRHEHPDAAPRAGEALPEDGVDALTCGLSSTFDWRRPTSGVHAGTGCSTAERARAGSGSAWN